MKCNQMELNVNIVPLIGFDIDARGSLANVLEMCNDG